MGGFYPPKKIFIDIKFLNTLSRADFQSGIGEMCHYFIVAGEKQFLQYKNDYKKSFNNKEILVNMIANSLKIKKAYIEIDEFDQKERQVFNYSPFWTCN